VNKKLTIVANWKMYFIEEQAANFISTNLKDFSKLTQEVPHKIVICPSFTDLTFTVNALKETKIQIGAQDCAAYQHGAFTGQTSAASLRFLGCTHCIIGHSERRAQNGETSNIVAQKALRAIEHSLSPIICIGETLADYETGKTYDTLSEQLKSISDTFLKATHPQIIYFAYEPVWAIGTGQPASVEHLEKVFNWLHNKLFTKPSNIQSKLIYGGSVTSSNASKLANIPNLDGFLVGGASTDFQEFVKIVKCCNT
jgi:triosephosphate isomerase